MAAPDDLLTPAQVGDWLGKPTATLKTWRHRGAPGAPLPYVRVGQAVRYRRRDVETWLAANTTERARDRRVPARWRTGRGVA